MIAMFLMLKIIPFHHGDAEALRDAIRRLYGGRLGKSLSLYFIVCARKYLFFNNVLDGDAEGATRIQVDVIAGGLFHPCAPCHLQAATVTISRK